MTVVEVTVRWRPARSAGEFGELPPWQSSSVREESDGPEGEGPARDLVSELARTATGPLVARVIDNRRSLFLWIDGGDVAAFLSSTDTAVSTVPLIVRRPPGDDPEVTRTVLYALAEVGRAALVSPRGGGETRGKVTHITDLFDAMQGWCAGTVDGTTLDAKAKRAKNRGAHAPKAWGIATDFANACLLRAAQPRGSDVLVAWRATVTAALDTAAAFSSERLVRAVFCDHMAESIARTQVELFAAGWQGGALW